MFDFLAILWFTWIIQEFAGKMTVPPPTQPTHKSFPEYKKRSRGRKVLLTFRWCAGWLSPRLFPKLASVSLGSIIKWPVPLFFIPGSLPQYHKQKNLIGPPPTHFRASNVFCVKSIFSFTLLCNERIRTFFGFFFISLICAEGIFFFISFISFVISCCYIPLHHSLCCALCVDCREDNIVAVCHGRLDRLKPPASTPLAAGAQRVVRRHQQV